MKPTAFKVVGRYRAKDQQSSWLRGKPGTQCKKAVYTSRGDFDKYSPELIERWGGRMALDIELYQMMDGKWVAMPRDEKGGE